MECLEEEVRDVWEGCKGGIWSAADVRRTVCLDSAVKQSLRISGLNAIGSSRRVSTFLSTFLLRVEDNTDIKR